MNTLFRAFNSEDARTENGGITNSTSFSKCLDLFNIIGSNRGNNLTKQFTQAYAENPEVALRILQWARDCRGGAGEREVVRIILRDLMKRESTKSYAVAIVRKLPTLGYWKDLVNLYDVQELRPVINEMVAVSLAADDGLCAKYMPRKGATAAQMRKALGLTAKEWRKLLVSMSNTVEQKMCAKKWDEIDFGKIPSLAAARYQKAFMKNAEVNYKAYQAALEKGEAKINASTLYPYDVVKSARSGIAGVADQQWKALPNYLEGTDTRVMPMIDVSGSMCTPTAVNGISAMDVAISLGMYLSERQSSIFKDHYMTFSESPTMERATGTLTQRWSSISRANWGMSTDVQKAFDMMLNSAKRANVAANEMPNMIIILSDMEFNPSYSARGFNTTAYKAIKSRYEAAGYEVPKLVWWNLSTRNRGGNSPVQMNDDGTCMVSGFSPAIMKSVLSATEFSPYSVMLEAVMVEKYAL